MAEGVDFATPASLAQSACLDKQVGFVARYLCPQDKAYDWKRLGASEAAQYRHFRIPLVLVWETAANRALAGQTAGVQDAASALGLANRCGFDVTKVVIYFAIDFDATPAQQAPIAAYFKGAAEKIPVGRLGAYGGYWPLKRLKDAGLVNYLWQTVAWSGTNLDKRVSIFQYHNGGKTCGLSVDHDRSLKLDYGQNPRPLVPVPPVPILKRSVFKVDVTLSNGNHLVKVVKFPALYLRKLNLQRIRPVNVEITKIAVV